jgi:hypothetical protein
MQSEAASTEEYINSLPEGRKEVIEKLHNLIVKNLPKGFSAIMNYGMIGYVVPHSLYPDGYHCDPKLPLPFMGLASQKNFISFYHMGIYADKKLLAWFTSEYTKHSKSKLDMGKSCIRFKKPDQIPFVLITELVKKMSVTDWINIYEKEIKKKL